MGVSSTSPSGGCVYPSGCGLSLRADIDMILEARVPEFEASSEPAEDTVMAALFATIEIPPPPPREHANRSRGFEEDADRS